MLKDFSISFSDIKEGLIIHDNGKNKCEGRYLWHNILCNSSKSMF